MKNDIPKISKKNVLNGRIDYFRKRGHWTNEKLRRDTLNLT